MLSLPLSLRLALKECLTHRLFSLFFVFNLALGLAGLIAIDSFKYSIEGDILSRSQAILTGDIRLTSRSPWNSSDQQTLRNILGQRATSDQVSFYSMARTNTTSRLVDIQVVDSTYPLYGHSQLQRQGRLTKDSPRDLLKQPKIWLYPELLAQLQVNLGDTVYLGNQAFEISDVVLLDASSSAISFRFAPRVYIGAPYLAKTGLVKPGSRLEYMHLVRLNPEDQLDIMASRLRAALSNPDIRIKTHLEASRDLNSWLNNLNDYLGLIAIIALLLSNIGAVFLFRSYILQRTRAMAILLSLGSRPQQVQRIYGFQLVLLGLCAAGLTLLLSSLALWVVARFSVGAYFAEFKVQLSGRQVMMCFGLGVGASLFFCWPLLQRLRHVKPGTLFRENALPSLRFGWRTTLAYLPGIIVYWGLAIWQARSWKLGSFVIAALLLSALGLMGVAQLMLKVLSQKARRGTPSLAWKLALLNLVRHPLATLSSFLAIGLAVLMMALIPQIRDMMVNEIAFPPGQIPPGLFLFDIQDDQIEPLRAVLKSENLPLNHLSPLARVTLSSINGKKLQRYDPRLRPSDKEARRQARIRSLRRYNASSRSHLARSENLIQGRLFKGRYNWDNSPAEISLAEDTATHLGVTPGDTLGFELQGVEFEAILVGIRKVQWTSFEPNFHLLFQPGVLDDAPKSWLATLPELPLTRRVAVQRRLLADFPNLAMVDISGMVERLVTIVDQLLRVIGLMALVTLAAGFSVLFSIANYQSQERAPDLALLKTLGTRFDIIRHSVMLEFLLLSSLAAGVGTLLSFGVSFALGQYIFQFNWQIQPIWPLGTLIMTIVLGTLIGLLGTGPVLRISPQYFLQERGV